MQKTLDFYADKYKEDKNSIHMLNIQRLGLSTHYNEDAIKLKIKFKDEKNNLFHKPIVNNKNSPYKTIDDKVYYNNSLLNITIEKISEDTAEPYYFRGNNILVLNSTFLDPCNQKCLFCEQNNAQANKKRYSLRLGKEDLFDKVMVENKLNSLERLTQISVITSCTGTEELALKLVEGYRNEAKKRGFDGKILFATHEIRSEESIREIASYKDIMLAFTVECFENRDKIMPGEKGKISIKEINRILKDAKDLGIETTYFYIFGLDRLNAMREGFEFLKESISITPTGPNYQPQGKENKFSIKPLEYFLQAKSIYRLVHKGMIRFESCQNFRSLWPLENNTARSIIQ